jgi:hypothetical protein
VSSQIVTYTVGEDTAVSFEVDPAPGFVAATSADEVVGRVREAIRPAIEAAREVLAQVRESAPDQVEVKFGVKATGTMNWLVAKAATEGNFEITLSWQRRADGE